MTHSSHQGSERYVGNNYKSLRFPVAIGDPGAICSVLLGSTSADMNHDINQISSEGAVSRKMLLIRNMLFSLDDLSDLSDASTAAHYKCFGDEVERERPFQDLLWKQEAQKGRLAIDAQILMRLPYVRVSNNNMNGTGNLADSRSPVLVSPYNFIYFKLSRL